MNILRNSPGVLAASVVIALAYPDLAPFMEHLIMPVLLIMMTFSMMEIELKVRWEFAGVINGFLLNYLLLSGLILVLASFLSDTAFYEGFVVMAAVPPAVAVLPLTKLLDGDIDLSLYSEALCYLISLALMPAMIFMFTRKIGVSVLDTIEIIILLILLPLILSRYVRKLRIDPVIPINLAFFAVIYTVIGLNRSALFGEGIAEAAVIAVARTFIVGLAVYWVTGLIGVELPRRISYTLLASFKNLGLSAAVAILLFDPRAGIPSALCIITETAFYILFSFGIGWKRRVTLL
jgi:BASS family bile acid:Na+ symporter